MSERCCLRLLRRDGCTRVFIFAVCNLSESVINVQNARLSMRLTLVEVLVFLVISAK